jgi:hypothetical protein
VVTRDVGNQASFDYLFLKCLDDLFVTFLCDSITFRIGNLANYIVAVCLVATDQYHVISIVELFKLVHVIPTLVYIGT